jgi:FG-GAP repeat
MKKRVCMMIFTLSCALPALAQGDPPVAFRQLAKLAASDGQEGDILGYSLALSGNTVVAGATQPEDGAGKVYVFVEPASGWGNATQVAELTPSDGVSSLEFGSRVAIDGDTIVVAASPNWMSTGAPAVYVFVEPQGGWINMTETAKLTLAGGIGLGGVAVHGNIIAAGAPDETVGSNADQGAVYLYTAPQTGWRSGLQPKVRLNAGDGQANDGMGFALAFNGETVVTSVFNRAAYVFVKPMGGWATATQTAELTSSHETGSDGFGASVAINGGTVVVGAPETASGFDGAAYIYKRPSAGWVDSEQSAQIAASDSGIFSYFGNSVSLGGELIAVGAPGAQIGSNENEGAAYVFEGATEVAKLIAIPGLPTEEVGESIATDGTNVFAGASGASGPHLEQGRIYVFGP